MIFVDTSGLFSYLSDRDPDHQWAKRLMDAAGKRYVHTSVLSELVALAHSRRFDRAITLKFISIVMNSGDFDVIWLSEADHRESLALLQARPDKKYSLCDAASFVLMRRFNIREALTTDHHFEQEGFVRLLNRL